MPNVSDVKEDKTTIKKKCLKYHFLSMLFMIIAIITFSLVVLFSNELSVIVVVANTIFVILSTVLFSFFIDKRNECIKTLETMKISDQTTNEE